MKKFLSIFIITIFLANSFAFAESQNMLKLEDALKTGVENSSKLKIDDLTISSSHKEHDNSVSDASDLYLKSASKSDSTDKKNSVFENNKNKELTPEEKELAYEMSKKTRLVDESSLKIDIYNAYYNLMKANNSLDLKTKEVTYLKAQYKDIYNKYLKGLVSKNDYKMAQLNLKNNEMKLNFEKRSKKKLVTKLYNVMGQGYNPDIKPLEGTPNYEPLKLDIEAVIAKAIENRADVYKSTKEVELREKEFELAKDVYLEDDLQYMDSENSLEEAKLNLDVAKLNIEFELRTGYNNLQNMLDTIEINKQEVEKYKIDYSTIELKNKLGMATLTEVSQVKLSLDKANTELNNSIIDYVVAKYKFDAACGIGPALN